MLGIHGLTVVLLVQVRGEMALLLSVPAVLLHHSVMDIWAEGNVVNAGYWEIEALPAVTAVLLHYSAMDTWTDCNFVSTG